MEGLGVMINMVNRFELIEGRKVKDFKLHIDLVYTGLSERMEMRQDYVIMTLDTKQLREEAWS